MQKGHVPLYRHVVGTLDVFSLLFAHHRQSDNIYVDRLNICFPEFSRLTDF